MPTCGRGALLFGQRRAGSPVCLLPSSLSLVPGTHGSAPASLAGPEEGRRGDTSQPARARWSVPAGQAHSSCRDRDMSKTLRGRRADGAAGMLGPGHRVPLLRSAPAGLGSVHAPDGSLLIYVIVPGTTMSGPEVTPPRPPVLPNSNVDSRFVTAEQCLKLLPQRLKEAFRVSDDLPTAWLICVSPRRRPQGHSATMGVTPRAPSCPAHHRTHGADPFRAPGERTSLCEPHPSLRSRPAAFRLSKALEK